MVSERLACKDMLTFYSDNKNKTRVIIVLIRIQHVKVVQIICIIVLTYDNPGIDSNQAAYLKTQEDDKRPSNAHHVSRHITDGALLLSSSPARIVVIKSLLHTLNLGE